MIIFETKAGMKTDKENSDYFSHLIGEQLSAIVFVMDYLQLQFDDYLLSIMTPLTVSDENYYSLGDSGYRDALCRRIAQKVTSTVLAEDYLDIIFADHAGFRISLKDEDYAGAEAINFHFPKESEMPMIVF